MKKFNDFEKIVQTGEIFDISELPPPDFFEKEAFCILSENDNELKPFAIINIKSIDAKENFDLLISHLINHDGRIREAASFCIADFAGDKTIENFFDNNSIQTVVQGLLDINPNVARNIVDFISISSLKEKFYPLIIEKINLILSELKTFENPHFTQNSLKSNKNHAKNKFTFNLYWLLAALSVFDIKNDEKIENILTKTSLFLDYTIREKTALILSKMENPPDELLRKLKNDVNIYVKNQLL